VSAAASRPDDDHAVGCLRAVLRGGGGILQHVHRLDVVGVEIGVLAQVHPVDDVERRDAAADEILSANDDLRGPARLAGTGHVHAGDPAAQRLFDRRHRLVAQRLTRDIGDGVRDVAPRLRRVTDDHLLGECRGCHDELEAGRREPARRDGDGLFARRETDPLGTHDVRAGWYAEDGVPSVRVRDRAEPRGGDADLHALDGLAGRRDGAADVAHGLRSQRRGRREEEERDAEWRKETESPRCGERAPGERRRVRQWRSQGAALRSETMRNVRCSMWAAVRAR
jgi:hypothetical protein